MNKLSGINFRICFSIKQVKKAQLNVMSLLYVGRDIFVIYLVTFTEQTLNGKLHFLCSGTGTQAVKKQKLEKI